MVEVRPDIPVQNVKFKYEFLLLKSVYFLDVNKLDKVPKSVGEMSEVKMSLFCVYALLVDKLKPIYSKAFAKPLQLGGHPYVKNMCIWKFPMQHVQRSFMSM